jgi:flagellar hook assembly protein FlgD
VVYDKVGNIVATLPLAVTNEGVVFHWNGTNTRGRVVGNGTYLCYLYISGGKESKPIGVIKRTR